MKRSASSDLLLQAEQRHKASHALHVSSEAPLVDTATAAAAQASWGSMAAADPKDTASSTAR